ncbi:hypothetical protein niasHT_010318 [Heterodera trifolii]|uniref:PAZ domain-containing protein n=1 Tax=Heterodera trifolii TaxID=157864 RepID=A0ABD2M5V8_9BILA
MAAKNENGIQLPQKLNNDHGVRGIAPVDVLINAFELNLKGAPDMVYQHELRFVGGKRAEKANWKRVNWHKDHRMSEYSFAKRYEKCSVYSECKETRRELHWSLWRILLDQNANFFGSEKNKFSYDCALLLYSVRRLMVNGEMREFVINVESLNALSVRSRAYLRSCERVKAFLTATEEVEVRNMKVTEPGGDQSVCQFLELLSTQRMYEKNQHFVFGNRMFEKNSVLQLQGIPLICKEGMQKNVRFVGDSPQQSTAVIQLDAKKSAFFPAIGLVDFVGYFINSDPHHLENDVQQKARVVNKQIKGLAVQTIHLPENQMTFSASGLTDRGANEITFMIDNHQTNLVQYYDQKYSRRLRYPCLACVIHRRGNQESYFPMEVLNIVDGQRVPLDKQTPKLAEQMIKKCQVLPVDLPRGIETQRDKGMIQNANPFFRAHEIRVETNMMQAEAQLLYPPAICFSAPNEKIEPNNRGVLDFRLADRGQPLPLRYSVPCEFPKVWAVVIVQNSVQRDQCRMFCECLIRCAHARGVQMQMPPRVDNFEDTSIDQVCTSTTSTGSSRVRQYDVKLLRPEYDVKLLRPEYDVKLLRPEYDVKLLRPEYDVKLLRPEYDVKLLRPEYDVKLLPGKGMPLTVNASFLRSGDPRQLLSLLKIVAKCHRPCQIQMCSKTAKCLQQRQNFNNFFQYWSASDTKQLHFANKTIIVLYKEEIAMEPDLYRTKLAVFSHRGCIIIHHYHWRRSGDHENDDLPLCLTAMPFIGPTLVHCSFHFACVNIKSNQMHWEGRLRAIGVSNFNVPHLEQLIGGGSKLTVVLAENPTTGNCFGTKSSRNGLQIRLFNFRLSLAWPVSQGMSVLPRSLSREHIRANFIGAGRIRI